MLPDPRSDPDPSLNTAQGFDSLGWRERLRSEDNVLVRWVISDHPVQVPWHQAFETSLLPLPIFIRIELYQEKKRKRTWKLHPIELLQWVVQD